MNSSTDKQNVDAEKQKDDLQDTFRGGSMRVDEGSSSDNDEEPSIGFFGNVAMRIARYPHTHMWTSLILAVVIGMIGMVVGDFSVSADNAGWQSRGTLIADRHTQVMLTEGNVEELFFGGDAVWEDLLNNVQPGWESDDDEESRRLGDATQLMHSRIPVPDTLFSLFRPRADRIEFGREISHNKLPFHLTPDLERKLQENLDVNGCDMDWYTSGNMTSESRLWPVWKARDRQSSVLDQGLLSEICEAEANTQAHLEAEGLCISCDSGCLPPYSIVLYARLTVDDGFSLSCTELAEAWGPIQPDVESQWTTCVEDINNFYDITSDGPLPESCPDYFSPDFVEDGFSEDGKSAFTSSIFATIDDIDSLYDELDNYDKAGELVQGAYDTQLEDFLDIYLDEVLNRDMILALSTSLVVVTAIFLHTRSPFLTTMGLLQIILSFPLSYFTYTVILQFSYFPFLNFIGIFVVFALGAGDVFIAVDKWRNARVKYPTADVQRIAAIALPDAAEAMLLTTLTTSVAFFATAICPVAPIKMFSVFCGLLVIFDYLMNMLLVFPALCIYDNAVASRGIDGVSCCVHLSFSCTSRKDHNPTEEEIEDEEVQMKHNRQPTEDELNDEETYDGLQKLFIVYYDNVLHRFRWPLLVASVTAIAVCTYFASKLDLPTSSDVRILEENVQFEQNYAWRQNLLSTVLEKSTGSTATMIWGVKAADTGNHNDPDEWSQLVLDENFDPSTEENQVYLSNFCDEIFEQDFAIETEANYSCPMQKFDAWLQEQASAEEPEDIYAENCGGAVGLPMSPGNFHSCMITWSKSVNEYYVLSYEDKVKIVFFPFASRVRYDDQYDVLDAEWTLIENWVSDAMDTAPEGVNKAFFSSYDFWWYDTNGRMISAAYSAVAIAIGCSAFVILLVSRSPVLTFFSTITIWYVLVSVTATLVSMGWTLGFLESVCFAILIGVSVDFVIHFSFAYTKLPGHTSRGVRTKFALVSMGRSILSTAAATILSSLIMLFTIIIFFKQFGLVLVMAILQATIGSFVVFLSMTDTIGPRDPTYMSDKIMAWCFTKKNVTPACDEPSE
eukprot:Nitzschia sp. Nitz4//scaffold228_size32365//15936//19222//NITZ4_007906-RA/size32365-augustus-gene-0.41-mRNA-1//-1//CDS//3329542819//4636//frame0